MTTDDPTIRIEAQLGVQVNSIYGPISLNSHNLRGDIGDAPASWGSFFDNPTSFFVLPSGDPSPVSLRDDGGQFGLLVYVGSGWKLYGEIYAEAPTDRVFLVDTGRPDGQQITAQYTDVDGAYWYFVVPDLGDHGEARIGIVLEAGQNPIDYTFQQMRFWLFN